MKITFVIPNANMSGGIRVVAIYAERLKKLGHDVLIVSAPPQMPSYKQQLKSVLKGQGLIVLPTKQESHVDYIDVEHHVIDKVRPITDEDVPDADVVIATWWETAEWVAALSPQKGAKAYFLQHYETFDYLPKDRVNATWKLPMHKITIAEWLVNLAKGQFGDADVSLVPNSVDTHQFFAPERSMQQVPTVGVMYSTVPFKGCDLSLEAYHLAAKNIPNLKLMAFGTEEIHPDLPLPENSEYFQNPAQTDIRNIYAMCDAWLFSSRSEGFGLPILEAMACRTPVIGVPSGAAPEMLKEGAGVLVEPNNPALMAKAIEAFFTQSHEDWKNMSDRAFQRVQDYSWDDATKKFEAALEYSIKNQY